MKSFLKHTYILSILISITCSCNQLKFVPEGKYLLKKNIVSISKSDYSSIEKIESYMNSDISVVIKQKANYKTLGLKLKLLAFNMIDSSKITEIRSRKIEKIKNDNRVLLERQNKINERRINRAKKKGKSFYKEKKFVLGDSTLSQSFFREKLKYKIGEPPVILDTSSTRKTVSQMHAYLKSKGYYEGKVTFHIDTLKRRKVNVHYAVQTGERLMIDSVRILAGADNVKEDYLNYLKKHPDQSLKGKPLDRDMLESHREKVAKFMRDDALYGFSYNHMNYVVDTISKSGTLIVGILFNDKVINEIGHKTPHQTTYVRQVYFHLADTSFYKGNFLDTINKLGLNLLENQFITTIDTLQYTGKLNTKDNAVNRTIVCTYNTDLLVLPELLERQNFTEKDNYFKEYYLDRTLERLNRLGVFQTIKPRVVEVVGSPQVDVHYYLIGAKKQSFSIQPKATNTNGFLGVMSSINYGNKNLFGGAEKFTFSINGGFESQPIISGQVNPDNQNIQLTNAFNTIEIGPVIKLEIPRFFPLSISALNKRQRPKTILSIAYNYQKRKEFNRHVFQLNYSWDFLVGKNQTFQLGLPFASVIKYVNIRAQDATFLEKLNAKNDLFFINAFSNQLIWEDFKIGYIYRNNKALENSTRTVVIYNGSLNFAGNLLSRFKFIQDTVVGGQYGIFKVGYSQFARMDNELITSVRLSDKSSFHYRIQAGLGMPYGNSKIALPYDYSFFAGGTNDNRGWRSRTLGPGAYQYYLDENRTLTQIADIRLGSSVEYRLSLGEILKLGLFTDVGNVWLYNEDDNRPGAKFSSNWYKELALSAGFGLRFDMEYFVLRTDFGFPITNPSLPEGERWAFQKQTQYYQSIESKYGVNYDRGMYNPFPMVFNFGIGYPF